MKAYNNEINKGDFVLLYLNKKRKFLVKAEEKRFGTDKGIIDLGEIIGKKYGIHIKSHLGYEFIVTKPNIIEIIYNAFKRKTQVLYPKDVGYIILTSGVGPGSRVVEAGAGSGFLTAILAYYVRPNGHVYSYEIREDLIELVKENLSNIGLLEYVTLKHKDITKGIDESDVDAIILDMSMPWKVVRHAYSALKNGGVFVAFLPTINQVERTVEKLRESNFIEINAIEIFLRNYKVAKGETRPETLMIAHTGYIVHAKKP